MVSALDYYIYVRYLWGMKWVKENWFRVIVLLLLFWVAYSFSAIADNLSHLDIYNHGHSSTRSPPVRLP